MATPSTSTTRYPDEYLERWGEVFTKHRLDITLGITFEKFMYLPEHYMNKYHELMNSEDHLSAVALRLSEGEFAPLTAKQAAVRERVYQQSINQALGRACNGTTTVEDADLLERCIRAARGIRHVPRQNNGHPVEKMTHHRHPKSQAAFPRGGKS